MNQSKKIEISKSTFISLKAELLRKQDEVNKAKLQSKNQIENFVPASKIVKTSDGLKQQKHKNDDQPRDAEEAEALRKSKQSLERKTKLYDHLSQRSSHDDSEEQFLVQFNKKQATEGLSKNLMQVNFDEEEQVESTKDDRDDSDDEWIDYVDCLGRTRRCLKTDLDYIQNKDNNLKKSLEEKQIKVNLPLKEFTKEGECPPCELVPPDAYKEMLREQWEQKEKELMNKDSVHYEDVLFNGKNEFIIQILGIKGENMESKLECSKLANYLFLKIFGRKV